jgi:hypothetical protein
MALQRQLSENRKNGNIGIIQTVIVGDELAPSYHG